ncbi:XRE family transcriptional regulator [Brucella intermedia]|uniref:XRE family transcriptional regulator n=1 Tax=Brucella intermedia TaxID=94625 RepID=UPI00244C8557|nr:MULTISPECIES: LexA family transcriptional regulator [Brucella/Ochrobactrum group]WGG61494.1 LexA family transcriptional regulator [Brucella intermedia]
MTRKLPNRQIKVNSEFAYLAMELRGSVADICHMDKKTDNRIREWRTERDLTIEQLAEATGLSVSYVSRLESGERNLSVRNMNLFAHALNVEPKDLLAAANERPKTAVAVMGRIGAGAEIRPDEEQIPPEGLYEIETFFPLPDDAIAFEIEGDSQYPRYDPGDIIICWRHSSTPEHLVGSEAAVKTADGRRYLKRILRGSQPGTFDLESHNAPPIRGVEIQWAGSIQSVIRMGQWKKLPSSERVHMMRKMTAQDK